MIVYFHLITAGRCESVPPVIYAHPNTTIALKGTTVNYTCLEGFNFPSGTYEMSTCNGVSWSPTSYKQCSCMFYSSILTFYLKQVLEVSNVYFQNVNMLICNIKLYYDEYVLWLL